MADKGAMIETERLALRNWRDGDSEAFERHCNTPAVMRWLGGVKSREAMAAVVADRFVRWQEERGFTFWVVERKSDRAFLGFCGIKLVDDPGSPFPGEFEIGWRLREDAWGQGFAREAAAASLEVAFERLGAERVVALTVPGNVPSWRLMERLGMTRRSDLDFEGPIWAEGPVIVYEIGREEWQRS